MAIFPDNKSNNELSYLLGILLLIAGKKIKPIMVQSTQNLALERNVYGSLRHRGDHGKTLAKNRNIHGKIAQKDHLRVFSVKCLLSVGLI